MDKEPNINYFSNLFQIWKFKKIYRERFDDLTKKSGEKLGIWGLSNKNNQYGIIDEDGDWSWRNTPNTHPYCLHDFWYLYREKTGKSLNFDNSLYYKYRINELLDFVEENWELFFTTNIETKYYLSFMLRCNKSWTIGQITLLCVVFNIKKLFPELNNISLKYGLSRGDTNDFKGIDLIVTGVNYLGDILTYTIQIKNGTCVYSEYYDAYEVKSSVNDLSSPADYYCFVNISDNKSNIWLFKNDKKHIEKKDDKFIFKKNLFDNRKMEEFDEISQKLMEISKFCFKNKIEIKITNKGYENSLTWNILPEKVLNLTLGDFNDVNLYKLLSENFELFKTEILVNPS